MKLDRASEHIIHCQAMIREYLAQRPYRLMRRRNPQTGEVTLYVKQDKPTPWKLGLVIGDAIHNIRASLDVCMFNIISKQTDNPLYLRAVQFPFAWRAQGLGDAINNRRAKLAGKNVVRQIEELKPYGGGNQILYDISELDVIDKHKKIVVIGSVASARLNDLLWPMTHAHGAVTVEFLEGAELNMGVLEGPVSLQEECERQPAFSLCFPSGGPFMDTPVAEALGVAIAEANRAILAIEGAARADGTLK